MEQNIPVFLNPITLFRGKITSFPIQVLPKKQAYSEKISNQTSNFYFPTTSLREINDGMRCGLVPEWQ